MHVCVVGLGVNGAAAVGALARRGVRVSGIDALAPPHTRGSSHGETRILREAYFEHPLYVPLVRAALQGWLRLERDLALSLFRRTGVLNIGAEGGALVTGVRASVGMHDITHEILDSPAARARFPGIDVPRGQVAIFEPGGGVLAAEACVEALLRDAVRAGATLRMNEHVRSWRETRDGVRVETSQGTLEADALVLAMGAWLAGTDEGRALGLAVERQTVFWFDATPGPLPVLLWESPAQSMFYAIPGPGSRWKAALHHDGERADPHSADRQPTQTDEARVRAPLAQILPDVGRRAVAGSVCLYTNTADGHFVIGALPGRTRTYVASACSGHGFKFAPAVGELLADLVLERQPGFDPEPFGARRLVTTAV